MNDVKLQEGHPVDENLRPLKVGGKSTAIETAQHGDGARVNGNLEVTGNISGNILDMVLEDLTVDSLTVDDVAIDGKVITMTGSTGDTFTATVATDGVTTLATNDESGTAGHLTLEIDGDITIDAASTNTYLKVGGTTYGAFKSDTYSELFLYEAAGSSTDDYFRIRCKTNGETDISTTDASATAAHLTLDADGQIKLDAINAAGTDADGILLKTNGTTFGTLTSHHSLSTLTLFEAGGSSTDDYFNITVDAAGATTISTVDAGGAVGHLTLDPDGELNLTPVTEVKSDAPLKIKEAANAVADTAAYGQLWTKNETPCELYFTTDAGDDIQLTDGTSAAGGGGGTAVHYWEHGGKIKMTYNNWYWAIHTSYGFSYYSFFYSTSSASLPTSLHDSYTPSFLAPRDGTVTAYTIVGNITTGDTVEWALMKGTQPTFGSAGNWTLSQIGASQSAGGTANILYKWEQTGLSVALNKNDMVLPIARRTTDNDSSTNYCEFAMHITLE